MTVHTLTRGDPRGPAGSGVRSRLATSAVLLMVVIAGAIIVSLALLSETENVTNNTFSTGTLDLTATPATALFTVTAMQPGDVVVDDLLLTNAGDVELRHAMTSIIDSGADLADDLQLTVKIGVTTCTAAGFDTDGSVLYGPAVLGTVSPGTAIYGDATPGADAGDRVLAAAASETLCLEVELPSSFDGSTATSTSTTATLRFDAEQTANNP